MLHRFLESQRQQIGSKKVREWRPWSTLKCHTVKEAEKWRDQVCREIGKKMSKVHDPNLDETVIRDCNDELNRLLAEKKRWEHRIRELGGPNYLAVESSERVGLDDGVEIPGSLKGYKYFGRAKNLPGILELFEEAREELLLQTREKSREELLAQVNQMEYFGFGDDANADLLAYEARAPAAVSERQVQNFRDLLTQLTAVPSDAEVAQLLEVSASVP